ncbi:MAG TPA: ATP-binding protein, partial [Flavobacterium sp.]|nr:ATP-binding protein [Flavobacterium sp.]
STILTEDIGDDISADALQMLTRLNVNSRKLGEMVMAILDLSRIGRQELNKEILDMTEMAKNAVKEHASPSANNHVEVLTLPPVSADAELIRLVWNHLVSNAVKFASESSGIKIMIGSRYSETGVVYFIKDNGVGFEMQHAHRLFKAFQRLHNTADYSGMGMGLALVDKILKRHNGKAWIESEIGTGTTVYFELPVEV